MRLSKNATGNDKIAVFYLTGAKTLSCFVDRCLFLGLLPQLLSMLLIL
jgi:hypothetical protein